jgi:hypothetical protein
MKFELEDYHRGITDKELIADLQRIASELNRTSVSRAEYTKRGKYGQGTHERRFGSWNKAIEKAGLISTNTQPIPEEELVNDLKRVSGILKKTSLDKRDYERHGKYSYDVYCRRFGNWVNALKKACLTRTGNYRTTEEEYLKNLGEVWVKLGRQPHYSDMQMPFSKYSGTAYLHKFGKWRTALEKFVAFANKEEIVPTKKLIEEIKVVLPTKHKTKREINWRLRFLVMRRDNFKCKNCGRSPATDPSIVLHVDHIKPYSKGGETIMGNLQTLCSKCNIGKSNLE